MTSFDPSHETPFTPTEPTSRELLGQALGQLGVGPESLALLPIDPEEATEGMATSQADRKREEIDSWLADVHSITADQASARSKAEVLLAEHISSGLVLTQEDAAKRLAAIDTLVAGAAHRTHVFNRSNDPKYNRTQSYIATVDDAGNIWGDFKPVRNTSDVSGQPITAGRHLIKKNPTV